MVFNSFNFALFLPIVFVLYWFVMNKNTRSQNLILVIASFVFYASWDWRFLLLMIVSKSIDFICSIQMDNSPEPRRKIRFLFLSLFVNIGVLSFFKYFNFFAENFSHIFPFWGHTLLANSLNIVLPVGLSFYTLQALGYVIDVYQEQVKPTHSIVEYFAFISFFPLVLAGPIERASNLLNQLNKKREFDYSNAVCGSRQILWGLFKKVVIADSCAMYANTIFDHSALYSGSTHVVGALFFTFQIYCDFSGYSDMAIGIAKLFNINLKQNFAFPYFSRDIGEFWRRWHISLSSWLMDYIFKPLQMSFRNYKLLGNFGALLLTFIISGAWHGSNWTFLVWGMLNAIYFLPLLIFSKRHSPTAIVAQGKYIPSLIEVLSMLTTFGLTVFAWIFFRANSIGHALHYISIIFSKSLFTRPEVLPPVRTALVIAFIITEWLGREQQFAIANLGIHWNRSLRYTMYIAIIISIFLFCGEKQDFIYFQF
jgi:alginate O-acetyltransferase complex protein AlgI